MSEALQSSVRRQTTFSATKKHIFWQISKFCVCSRYPRTCLLECEGGGPAIVQPAWWIAGCARLTGQVELTAPSPPPLCPAWPRAGWGKHCVDCCPSAVLSWWNSVPCSVSVRWLAHPGTSTVGSVAAPTNYCTLLEKLTDDAQLYVTKF